MAMVEIPLLKKFLTSATSNNLDDVVDRLHYVWTVTFIILCSLFVGSKQHFGQPIQCMLPAHMDKGSWSAYGQYFCFVESTYRLSINNTVPDAAVRAKLRDVPGVNVNYYQWVPYFLAVQAVLFCIPNWFWRFFQGFSCMDIKTIVDNGISVRNETKMNKRKEKLDQLNEFITNTFEYRLSFLQSKKVLRGMSPTKFGGYSSIIYILSKAIALANVCFQMRLIGRFIGIESATWGFRPFSLSTTISRSGYVFTSPYFPLVTFCDMSRQTLSNIETNTLQCVIMLNMINEKIFIMLWYWFLILVVITFINLVYCTFQLIQPGYRESMLRFYLQPCEGSSYDFFCSPNKRRLSHFINNVLSMDGILLIRFINAHAGAMVTRDIVAHLWRVYGIGYKGVKERDIMEESLMAKKYRVVPSAPEQIEMDGCCGLKTPRKPVSSMNA